MKTETAAMKKNVIVASVPSPVTLKEIWDRVITRRPSGCYHIRFVSSKDERTLEVMPSYEGWSSVMSENQILPGMVGSGFTDYLLSREEITEFPVGRVEFLIAEEQGEEEFNILLWEDSRYYNALEALEFLRDKSPEAHRARFVCREVGKLLASMQEAKFYHDIESKLDLIVEGVAKEEDFRHDQKDCLSVTAIKDAAIVLIRFLSGVGSEVDCQHTMWAAREILRARRN